MEEIGVSNQRRLGRGLEALLGRSLDAPMDPLNDTTVVAAPEVDQVTRDESGQSWLSVSAIQTNPYQPRQTFDEAEISDLADSIREHGVLQPLVVRHIDDRFELIAGERRLRASELANWERVPVQIRDVSDRQMAELAIVENVQRKDLNAIEKAVSFQRYIDEYQCTQEDLASRVHIDRSTVANLIRLLELPELVKDMVCTENISQGHARALLPLGETELQIEFAQRIKQEKLSVRATEDAVQEYIHSLDDDLLSLVTSEGQSKPVPRRTRSEHLVSLEQQLRSTLGTKVDLKQGARGRGKVTIHFKNHDEFERLLEVLQSEAPQLTKAA